MARTTTRYVNFQTLLARGPSAAIVVKLMMACNDLSLANQALSDWKTEQPNPAKPRQVGAGMYFVRTEIAHLYEALDVIEEIRNDTSLSALVSQCDEQTQQSFRELQQFVRNGARRAEFMQLVGQIRHNLTFHYNQSGTLIERAISERAEKGEAQISSVTRGDTAYLWHFKIADEIVDSIVVHQIWAIPRESDVRIEADQVADRIHRIFLWLVDFSGEFIWKYCAH